MNWLAKKKNYSVLFTEDAADQSLLMAIDKELDGQQYQTFSNLCKQALWQFLSVSGVDILQPTGNFQRLGMESQSIPELGILNANFQRLEQRLIELQGQLATADQRFPAPPPQDFSQLQRLELHLSQLNEQLNQLQASVNYLKLAPVSPGVSPGVMEEPKFAQPEAAFVPESTEIVASEGVVTGPQPEAEPDPLLSRLSRLIEDF